MIKKLINRSVHRRLRQAELHPFALHCAERLIGNPAYAPLQAAALDMKEKCIAFAAALSLAENRGRDTVYAKDEARKALLAAIEEVAELLETHAADDPLYISNAGMPLRINFRRRSTAVLQAPEKLQASATKNSGEVLVTFTPVEGARMYAIEWSDAVTAGGQEPVWNNGQYSTSRRAILVVPPRREIRVRVKALASGQRSSAWSAAAIVSVS